jgi:hypothetical protein
MRALLGILLAGALVAPSVACTGVVRIYDEPRRDYHRWDDREERAYRVYLGERRREYVEFRRLNRQDQDDYWEWRHAHPDGGERDRR